MQQVLAMFPGQGSQYVGMGHKLSQNFPYTLAVFEEVEDACRLPIRSLCIDGPEADLTLTAHTQPCLLAVSIAYWKVIEQETGLKPTLFAGHSLGEYSALVAANKLTLSRAAYLVRQRGLAMQGAVPPGMGAMAAVMKVPVEQLEELCQKHSSPDCTVEIANYNSEAQLVVAGHARAVASLCAELKEMQARSVDLPVSAPFHSSLMRPARTMMEPLLKESIFQKNDKRLIANLTGAIVQNYEARYLIEQIDSPVRWIQSIDSARQAEITHYVEIGPGKVLFGLVRRMIPRDQAEVLATDDISEALTLLSRLKLESRDAGENQGKAFRKSSAQSDEKPLSR